MNKNTICKYCGKEKKLINSHIIPKNFYIARKEDRYLLINSKTRKYAYKQNGGYDSNILCGDCDNNILGEFDKEGYRVLFGDFNQLEEWSHINLGGYERKALDILKGKREYPELFKTLIYKNSFTEDINQGVLIAKEKTSKYKKYVIQMAGYCIEVMVVSTRITNKYKLQYETYFLNPMYACIIETPEVSYKINMEYNLNMFRLYEKGFVPPKPAGVN